MSTIRDHSLLYFPLIHHLLDVYNVQIFADLDTIAEAETFRLGRFFNTIFNAIPSADEDFSDGNGPGDYHDDTSVSTVGERDMRSSIGDEGIEGDDYSFDNSVDIEEDDYTGLDENGEVEEHVLGHVDPTRIEFAGYARQGTLVRRKSYVAFDIFESSESTHKLAADIVEVCRSKRRLNRNVVIDLVTGAIPLLRDKRNITFMDVAEGEKVTVVGDIHGQLSDLLHILDESGMPSQANKVRKLRRSRF